MIKRYLIVFCAYLFLLPISASSVQAVGGTDGAVITGNATEHNYLKHKERDAFLADLAACDGNQSCLQDVGDSYLMTSLGNNQELIDAILAGDVEKIAKIRAEIPIDMFDYQDKVLGALSEDPFAREIFASVVNSTSEIVYDGKHVTAHEATFMFLKDAYSDNPEALMGLGVDQFGVEGLIPNIGALMGARAIVTIGNLTISKTSGGGYKVTRNITSKTDGDTKPKTDADTKPKTDPNSGQNTNTGVGGSGVTQAFVNPDKLVSPTANLGTAQSRVNLARVTDDNGNVRGWDYAIGRHGKNATTGSNKSKFNIEDDQVRTLLQDRNVVQSPVYNIRHPNGTIEANKFGRQVDVGQIIGVDRNGNNVSTVTIITNRRGELINAFPGLLD